MSLVFEPNHYYWVLEEEEFELLQELMPDFSGEDFLSDFVYVDGKYYANYDDISSDELEFLTEWGLASPFLYIKSTQLTDPV